MIVLFVLLVGIMASATNTKTNQPSVIPALIVLAVLALVALR